MKKFDLLKPYRKTASDYTKMGGSFTSRNKPKAINYMYKALIIVGIYLVFSIAMDMIMMYCLTGRVVPRYWWFNIAFWGTTSLIILAMPSNIVRGVLSGAVIIMQTIINCVNAGVSNVTGDVFAFEMIANAGDAGVAFEWDSVNIPLIVGMIIMMMGCLLTLILVEILVKVKKFENKDRKSRLAIWMACFMCFAFPFGYAVVGIGAAVLKPAGYNLSEWVSLPLDTTLTTENIKKSMHIIGDDGQFIDVNNKVSCIRTYGTLGFYMRNVNDIFSNRDTSDEDLAEAKEYFANGKIQGTTFDTPISEGNNVITVLLESLEYFAIDPVLTPTLYALTTTSDDTYVTDSTLRYVADNSVKFRNYNSRNSSNVSEQYAFIGSFPYSRQAYYTMYSEDVMDMTLDFTLPALLKAETPDVKTSFFHPSTNKMYFRTLTMHTYGFDNVRLLEDMEEFEDFYPYTFNNFVRDSDFFINELDNIMTTESRFYSHISTITTHGSWDNKNPKHTERLKDEYDKLAEHWDELEVWFKEAYDGRFIFPDDTMGNLKECFINIKAATMDLDKGLEVLFKGLEERGLMDNTTVLLYGDHCALYNDLTHRMNGFTHDEIENTQMYNIPMFIYDSKLASTLTNNGIDMTGLDNNEFCSPSSFLPTLLDVLNVTHNSNYYVGFSAFSDEAKYNSEWSSINGVFDNNFFSYNIFNIEYSALDTSDPEYQTKLNEYICNSLVTFTKTRIIESVFKFNHELFDN